MGERRDRETDERETERETEGQTEKAMTHQRQKPEL